jgi:hypothetical protein
VQIIYSGDPNSPIQLNGTVVGAGAPRVVQVAASDLAHERQWRSRTFFLDAYFAGVIVILAAAGLLLHRLEQPVTRRAPWTHYARTYVLTVVVLLVGFEVVGQIIRWANYSGVPLSLFP